MYLFMVFGLAELSSTISTTGGGYAFARNWMYVLQRVTGLVALLFLGYVGRLHAAGVEVANTSQAAARASPSQIAAPMWARANRL